MRRSLFAIANGTGTCSNIQILHKVTFTNYNFGIICISLFVLTCSLCYVLAPLQIHSLRMTWNIPLHTILLVVMHLENLLVMSITCPHPIHFRSLPRNKDTSWFRIHHRIVPRAHDITQNYIGIGVARSNSLFSKKKTLSLNPLMPKSQKKHLVLRHYYVIGYCLDFL